MAYGDERTIQSGIHYHDNEDLTKYALFLSGLNVTHDVLQNYDPLRTGYGRIFMVRKPVFLEETIPNKLSKFKHIIEYGNTSISGIQDISQETNPLTGGYAGKSFEIPSYASDGTNGLSIQVYEFSGSPVREVIHTWINGMNDVLTGLAHYNGADTPVKQANQTAEFIYVSTDNTGTKVEYACMFANCFPKNIKNDHFNYQSGSHELVDYTIDFAGTKYESIQINNVAQELLDRYKILSNSLNFFSGISITDPKHMGQGAYYDYTDGQLHERYDSSGNAIPFNPNFDSNEPVQPSDVKYI